jgi:trehalose synthase
VHVNATATGGGVAELLHGLVPAQAADGVRVGWAVIGGDEEFFAFTKALHHLLHDRGPASTRIPRRAAEHYRATLRPQARWLAGQVTAGDVVVLHDPQTLGMAALLAGAGARVVWHCHIGTDQAGASGPAAVWRELAAELSAVDAVVTTLAEFAPPGVAAARRFVCPPAIDPLAPKNRELAAGEVAELLDRIGLTGPAASNPLATVESAAPLPPAARMVLQVSRWDPLKDMPGVLRCLPGLPPDVHLVLAGTDPEQIPDDPEGLSVLAEVRRLRDSLPAALRRRVHLVRTSMVDPTQAALLINALQRRADVVLQKSLAEGFGLTVTEAMAKRRAVVAADVGGLRSQITPGRTGLLVDPTDLAGVAAAVRGLLDDPARRRQLGARAAEAVADRYTMARLVAEYRAFAPPSHPANPHRTDEVGVHR